MKTLTISTSAMVALLVVALTTGCADNAENSSGPVEMSDPPPAEDHSGHDHDGDGHSDDAGHNHENEHEGPHHGYVIELGRSHEYHAEIVDDETANVVTVFILDKDLKELQIDATSITMNLMVDGEAKAFELAAATSGQASRFESKGKALFEALHTHEATGKLRVAINGTHYTAKVEHHDHEKHVDQDGHKH